MIKEVLARNRCAVPIPEKIECHRISYCSCTSFAKPARNELLHLSWSNGSQLALSSGVILTTTTMSCFLPTEARVQSPILHRPDTVPNAFFSYPPNYYAKHTRSQTTTPPDDNANNKKASPLPTLNVPGEKREWRCFQLDGLCSGSLQE